MQGTGLQLPGLNPSTPMFNAPSAPVYSGGMVRMESAASVMQRTVDDARQRAVEQSSMPVVQGLAGYVRNCFQKAQEAKRTVERDMLRAVRARRGEYEPEIAAEIRAQGGSDIYMMLFSTKARQAAALLRDALIGGGDEKPWTIKPTASPEISPELIAEVAQNAMKQVMDAEMAGQAMTGDQVRQLLTDYRARVTDQTMTIAKEKAAAMERKMEDQLQEGGWLEAFDELLDDMTTFKTAILKGPVIRKRTVLKWTQVMGGKYELQLQEELGKDWDRVDPFKLYPAPHSTGPNDSWLIEHHTLSRGKLAALKGVEGYSDDAISAVLDAHGTNGLHMWLQILTDKAQAEGRDPMSSESNSDLIDALQFWGPVSGKMLREWGMEASAVTDPDKEYEAEVWLIGNWVIRCTVNADPLARRPYYTTGLDRIPGAFWHNSLFDLIEDCCKMCNAAARAMANNLGIASGPQVVVNVDRMPAGASVEQLYPWKIHQATSDPMGSTAPPVTFFQPTSNAQELMSVYERFSVMADEQSGIPRYMTGNEGTGGAGRTASGLSMMIGNASKTIKNVVSNIDVHIIQPMLERLYFHNMRYSDDPDLKGDVNIVARGALSLATKEAEQVRRNEFLQRTANPIDMQIMGVDGRAYVLRETARSLNMDTDRVVPSTSVLDARAAIAAQAQMQQQPEPGKEQLMNGAPVSDHFSPTAA